MKGLQERFLNSMSKAGIPATFYLVNGFQMKGTVKAFDDYTILIECGSGSQMVFKHAISTISPQQRIVITADN